MLSHKMALVLVWLFLFTACADKPLKVINAECGSSVSMKGAIANNSLTFAFKPCTHCRSLRDVCNYIYFQGDTLCFSVECNQDIESATITAYFENPATRTTYKAERIEKVTKTVYGFSLVGSLLETIFWKEIIINGFSKTIKLPFAIHVTIEHQNHKVHRTISDTLYVQFAN